LNPEQREALRRAAREVLATRPGIALPLSGIRRRIDQDKLVDCPFTDSELRGALSLLLAIDHVHMTHDALGSTEHFQASGPGILAFERNQ
jgi:hypothetical protein